MNHKAIALMSGGLDSNLAIAIVKAQGIEIEGLNFSSVFGCCKIDAIRSAEELGVRITVVSKQEEYLKLIEKPKYGYGQGMNPCVDCRIHMFSLARAFMETVGGSFVISGEVLGQRPMSQKLHQLNWIERDSGLEGRILRPLSAKVLEPTLPEQEGIVDREKLYGISGRSRKELIDLARQWNLKDIPQPSTGCLLVQKDFAEKVRDVFAHQPDYSEWDFFLLKVGRHFRLDEARKLVVGRNEEENQTLASLFQEKPGGTLPADRQATLLIPSNFRGPSAILLGPFEELAAQQAGSILLRYGKKEDAPSPNLTYQNEKGSGTVSVPNPLTPEELEKLRI